MAWGIGLVLAAVAPLDGRAQDSSPLLKKLVDKGILTPREADEVAAEMGREERPRGARVEGGIHAERIGLFGDMRLRYDYADQQNAFDDQTRGSKAARNDRSRMSYRLRAGAVVTLPGSFEIGMRFATGNEPEEVTSTSETFGDAFSKDGIYLDRLYVRWAPRPEVAVTAGKFDFAMTKPLPVFWTTDMYWDPDVTVEGFAENFALVRGEWSWHLNLGQFAFGDVSEGDEDKSRAGDGYQQVSNDDGWLFAGQAGVRYLRADGAVEFRAAAGFWYWANAGDLAEGQRSESGGLVWSPPGSGNNVGDEFEIVDGYVEARARLGTGWGPLAGKDARAMLHLIWNLAPGPNTGVLDAPGDHTDPGSNPDDSENGPAGFVDLSDKFAWRLGLQLGSAERAGGWEAYTWYEQVGSDAVPDSFNDSEMAGGLTNHRGFGVRLSYAMRDWWMLRATLLNADWLDPDINQDLQRGGSAQSRSVLVDTVFRF
jgi:hypothetical protein